MKYFRLATLLLAAMLPATVMTLLVQVSTAPAQPIGTWQSFSSQSTVLDVRVEEDGRFWAVSEGGIFWVEGDDIAGSLAPTEGMHRINPATIHFDSENRLVWLGYNDGMFESYDRQSERFFQYTDIFRASRFSPRGINRIRTFGEEVVIATDFGIVVFEPRREITLDTYSNLGDFSSGTRVNDVMVHQQVFFAATPEGVAVANAASGDLVVPDYWTSYGTEAGFGGNVTALAHYRGDVLALMGDVIMRFDGTDWSPAPFFEDARIRHISTSTDGNYLVAWNEQQVMVRYPDQSESFFSVDEAGQPVNTVAVDDARSRLLVGTTNMGVLALDLYDGTHVAGFLPEGPYMNSFSDVIVSNGILASGSNNLWGSRGAGTTQTGYYLFRDGEWFSFNNLTHPVLQQRNFNSVYTTAASGDYFFFGSWGRGVAQHNRETDEITIWDSWNSPLEGISPGSAFIVASGLDTDRNGHLWMANWENTVTSLFRFKPENEEWTAFPRFQSLSGTEFYDRVTADSYGQLWLTVKNDRRAGRGLVVKRVEDNRISDGVLLTDNPGSGNLPHMEVNTVVQDRRGEIWVGTQRGLARFPFPQRIIDGSANDRQATLILNADETADSPFLLRTTPVTSIVVNSANQKWIGTDGEGLWLIEEDGGRHRPVRNFTTENSPLISNTIQSLAYDSETGRIFIATDLGLVSYVDVVRGSVAEMKDLFVYPNPFSYEREDMERVVIDRLSERTTIRILTVDGRLVRRMESQGGRVEWDVRDYNGDRVATGVYIIVSVDDQNDQRGVGKLVVIR
ncbi:two-component regulator propeller domain-containing protein [Balneolales bacterium ANBcel1]|nr:two-component regulator propeller domain-containing protein [Balneolales bacterium ANBcel1]